MNYTFKSLLRLLQNREIYKIRHKIIQRISPHSSLALHARTQYIVERYRCTYREIQASQEVQARHTSETSISTITWFLPRFTHIYFGGIYTILRFASEITRIFGVTHQFVITDTVPKDCLSTYENLISVAFNNLYTSTVVFCSDVDKVEQLVPTDACIATLWTTAYYALVFQQTKRKFYFIQDFEPSFYAAGSTSAQVEATYHFGFFGVFNTEKLREFHERDYNKGNFAFKPCVDTHIFFPQQISSTRTLTQTIFFYARPTHPRNGFELGIAALKILKERLGTNVRIVTAGQDWDVRDYGLQGIIENLGLLSYHQTAELYRTCDVGLAMMFTKHPSYLPFELMASGCLVVSNVNPATTWFLRDEINSLLSIPSADCIAERLMQGLQNKALRQRLVQTALTNIREKHTNWGDEVTRVYTYMCNAK